MLILAYDTRTLLFLLYLPRPPHKWKVGQNEVARYVHQMWREMSYYYFFGGSIIPMMSHEMETPHSVTVWFSALILTSKSHLRRNITKHHFNKMENLLLFITRVTAAYSCAVCHSSKWTGYEVHLHLLPSAFPAKTIRAHLSRWRDADMSSNHLASGVWGVIVRYEIKSHTYWQDWRKNRVISEGSIWVSFHLTKFISCHN